MNDIRSGTATAPPPYPWVRLLGPIEARGAAGPAVLSGARQRALLAVLALNAGTVVPQPRLVDALWGWDPPRTAVKTLHSHVARVRQALDACGLPGTLVTQHTGYLLAVPAEAVDAYRFEAAVRAAQHDLAESATDRAAAALRTGLDLWRGGALADGEPAGWAAAEAARLDELRVSAVEDMCSAELALGRHRLAVGELERLLVAHPYRERLTALVMLALYRCGRSADALDAYRRLREHLAEELGTDPGPEVQRLHTAILRQDPALDPPAAARATAAEPPGRPAEPSPAQLPAPAGHFTGRAAALSTLDGLLDAAGTQPRIAVVAGTAGTGKTAVAVHWAHRVAERFPDGQLFLDLGGHDPDTALAPADALAHLLGSLGVPSGRMPADLSARSALYRSILHDRRVLVLLDNAGGPDQVRPLIPATPASLLLVTSRHQPTALAAHQTLVPVVLDTLDRHEAVALLGRVLGADRVAREPEATRELAELCGRLPLALRIAAAKLTARPARRIADVAAELARDDRLDELSVPGDSRGVRTVFAGAYRALPPAAARLFRLLGLHPGPVFSAHLAAAVTGVPVGAARRTLDELVTAHLLAETGGGYRYHDLLRLYARERALADGGGDTAETIPRILDWYVATADAGNRIIDRGRDRVTPVLRFPAPEPAFPADHHAALSFLDGERANMLPIVRYAAEHGHDTVAWQLAYLLTGFFDSRGHWGDRVELCRWAVAAAQRGGDPGVEGLIRSGLGVALIMTRRYDEALETLHASLFLMRACGDERGEGHVYNNIAVASAGLRRFDDAVEAYQQALALHSANDNHLGVALSLNNIGDAYVRMGRPELSGEYLTRALRISRDIHNARLEAATLSSLGQAALALGDTPGGLDYLGQALGVRQQSGDRRYEADTRNNIGVAHLDRGEYPSALDQFQRALALSHEIVDAHLESVALANIGRVHLAVGDLVAAGSYLRLALTLRDRTPDSYEAGNVHRDLGELAERSGQPAEAREHWHRAVSLYRKANAAAEADQLTARRLA